MSSQRTLKTSILRQRRLLERTRSDCTVMRSCDNCNRLEKKYQMNNESNKCVKCVRLHRKCDLTFFALKWKRVRDKRERVYKELVTFHQTVSETMTKVTRLQAQLQLLEDKEQKIINRKFRNIAKLKKDERESSEFTLNNLLFDVFFKRFEIFSDFDWLNFSVETVAEASDSSWDFSLILKCSQYVRNLFTWSDNEADLRYFVDLKYFLLYIWRLNSLNQFREILFEWMYSSLQTLKEKYEISNVFA